MQFNPGDYLSQKIVEDNVRGAAVHYAHPQADDLHRQQRRERIQELSWFRRVWAARPRFATARGRTVLS